MKTERAAAEKRSGGDAKAQKRKSTANLIQKAITQLHADNTKVSISAVAKVAGITPALIHNTYPDLAEQIRSISGKGTRSQRDEKHKALAKMREANIALRAENTALKEDVAKLASINQKLLSEMAVLKGVASGKVIALLRNQSNVS